MTESTTTLLDIDNSVLLIVDIQTKLLNVMPEKAAEDILENSIRLSNAANLLNIPVFLTEQYPNGLGSTAEPLKQALHHSTTTFEKTHFSCLEANHFKNSLQNTKRQQVIIVGQEAHVCILQTALELIAAGYQVHVLEDSVCSRKEEHKFYALQRMQQQGVIISNFESVLFEWLKDSQHEKFNELSALLR